MRELHEDIRHRARLRSIAVVKVRDLEQEPMERLEVVDVVLEIRDDEVGVARAEDLGDARGRSGAGPDTDRWLAGREQRDDVVLRVLGRTERGSGGSGSARKGGCRRGKTHLHGSSEQP